MFIRRVGKTILIETFDGGIIVEKDMLSLKGNPSFDSDHTSTPHKKPKTPSIKPSPKKKKQDSIDLEDLQHIIKKFLMRLSILRKIQEKDHQIEVIIDLHS